MHALQRKVEAMEKVGAGAVADQALRKLIRLYPQKYEKQLAEVQKELEPFERQYGLSSEECYRRFAAGEMGDGASILGWVGRDDNGPLYRERVSTLQEAPSE